MTWGKWIIVSFVLFAGFIATLVTVCMRQDVNLVSKDYYKEELAYQEQIARMNNTNQLDAKPIIRQSGDFVEVEFAHFHKIENGSLKLFRPSDPRLDKAFVLPSTGSNKQSFSTTGLGRGMYRARMQWLMDGKEYYIETIIHI
jgi:hypothetical protein